MNSRLKPSDWLLVSGGLLLLVASVLPWWQVRWAELRATFDAFDYTGTGVVPLVLFLGCAVLIVIVKTDSLPLPAWLVHRVLVATAIGLGSALLLLRFLWNGFDDGRGVSRGVGLYVAVGAVLIALAGCVLSFREADDDEPDDVDDADDAAFALGDPTARDPYRTDVRTWTVDPGTAPVGRRPHAAQAARRRAPAERPPQPRPRRAQPTTDAPRPVRSRRRPAGPPPR